MFVAAYQIEMFELQASLAQLVEHALRKRMVVGSIPTGGCAIGIGKSWREDE